MRSLEHRKSIFPPKHFLHFETEKTSGSKIHPCAIFLRVSMDHACVRDEAVHRDTRPELRPTSHKSRSLDCKICEHIATIKSASLVIR
ncbi:serine/threonine-protein kinase TAO3-like [Anarrhichthys ocellatus]|uniref:serine/threonine-protein kinase TAO3-like n=1 Tax=Anarrhichthys ocellatus TaxID=433405 RepID=UPI0012ED1D5A|nr:serine/threonine-protein kinase TAO3-like [Anarrhichthys ocellatus]